MFGGSNEGDATMMKYNELDFGPDDAKGDARLSSYFLRIPEYDRLFDGRAQFVIGRKGTGKTALCQMIHDECGRAHDCFSSMLSLKSAPSAALFDSRDQMYRAPNEYISIWKFLIALETAKLILADESVDPAVRIELEQFLVSNFGNTDIKSLDAVVILKERQWKVGMSLPELAKIVFPGAEASHSTADAEVNRIHYGRAGSTLLSYISTIRTSSRYFLLFDELDEDYREDNRYFDLIISLFKAAYQVRKELHDEQGLDINPIVALREDIFADSMIMI
jgi:hypothetical protein